MKLYTVTINGIDHLMQLDSEDVKRYGNRAKAAPAKPKAEEKTTSDDDGNPPATDTAKK